VPFRQIRVRDFGDHAGCRQRLDINADLAGARDRNEANRIENA
jgi:hypothetical protein